MSDTLGANDRDEGLPRLIRTVRNRNIRESVAAVFLMVLFGGQLLFATHAPLGVAGRIIALLAAAVIAAVSWTILHLPEAELRQYPPGEHQQHWRDRLTTQATSLRFAWLWYVLPLLTGIVLIMLGRGGGRGTTIASISAAVIVGVIVGWINILAGRSIEQDRDRWFPH